jgi:hypothetical protein
MLVGVDDVAAGIGKEVADRGDQPGLIGAGEEQPRGGGLTGDREMIAGDDSGRAPVRFPAGSLSSHRFPPHPSRLTWCRYARLLSEM